MKHSISDHWKLCRFLTWIAAIALFIVLVYVPLILIHHTSGDLARKLERLAARNRS